MGRRKDEELLITSDRKTPAHIWGFAPEKTLNYGPDASCHLESRASLFYWWLCETSKIPSPCLWWGERSDASLLSPLSFQDALSYKATSWERKALKVMIGMALDSEETSVTLMSQCGVHMIHSYIHTSFIHTFLMLFISSNLILILESGSLQGFWTRSFLQKHSLSPRRVWLTSK